MIEREDIVAVSVRHQCELLELNRSSLYYEPVEIDPADIKLMNMIDEEFTKHPFFGVRSMAWRLSNTLTDDFCVECLKDALQYGRPEIFNTDQGSQFTSDAFTGALRNNAIAISMDGRGRCLDNIFVERLWRTVKYQNVYIKGYQNIPEAQAGLHEYFDFYNMERRHQSLSYKTPWGVFSGLEKIEVKNAPVHTV